MDELYYSPLDMAFILYEMDLGERETAEFILDVWNHEKSFLLEKYRSNKLKFVLDTYYWSNYLADKEIIDGEFSKIQKDAKELGIPLSETIYTSDFSNIDTYFKTVRLKILYGKGNKFIRIKRRSLLKLYGYKRISPVLLDYFKMCLEFYQIESYVRGGVKKSIKDIQNNEMITFRVKENQEIISQPDKD